MEPLAAQAGRLEGHGAGSFEGSQCQQRTSDGTLLHLMTKHEAQTESPSPSSRRRRKRRRHYEPSRRCRRTRIRKAGRRIVPIVLLIAQIPYLWRTKDFYSRLNSSRIDTVNDASYQALLRLSNATLRQSSEADAAKVRTNDSLGASRQGVVPASLYTPEASRPLSIRWIGRKGSGPTSVVRDGARRSLYVSIVSTCWYDPDPFLSENDRISIVRPPLESAVASMQSDVVVTVVDWATLDRDCHVLRKILSHPQCSVGGSLLPGSDEHSPNHTAFVYWDATNNPNPKMCLLDEHIIAVDMDRPSNASRIHYVRRSSVQDRYWNATAHWVSRGRLRRQQQGQPAKDKNSDSHVVAWYRSGHPLREAFVQELFANVKLTKLPKLPHRKRPWRVSVFHKPGNVVPSAVLRDLVSGAVLEVARNHSFTHRVDEAVGSTQTAISAELVPKRYVKSLIISQIVVVANHDEWEGHWRLLESMASGAMVLSEEMVAPPEGLQNGTNVVLYDSVTSLRHLLLYYATHGEERRRIAERGQKLALGLHRSWHDFERVMFGQPRTHLQTPFADAPPRRR
jgi:Glycosyl transferases group 1